MNHQIHFEKKFYQDKQTDYWISTTYPKIRAHTWVWEHESGMKVPKGFHVHHKDGNKSNNSYENLVLVTPKQHAKEHWTKDRSERSRQHCNKIREKTKDWHASDQGKEWHRKHAKEFNFGNWEPLEYNCQFCGKNFKSKLRTKEKAKFCSNNCKSSNRRKLRLDDIEKECAICKNKFYVNRYSKTITCSRSCGKIKSWQGRKLSDHTSKTAIP